MVVNMNVSWMRYASLFMLERFPELFDLMQEKGVDRARDGRVAPIRSRGQLPRMVTSKSISESIGNTFPLFSAERLVRRFGHLPAFRRHWPELRKVYGRGVPTGTRRRPNAHA